MIWVDIFKLGAEVHRGGHVVQITEEFANAMLRNHQRLTKEGAEIVVLREHEREGWVYGQVHGLRMWEEHMQAQMEFYLEDDRMAFNAGMLRRFSPGFALNFEHPHTGELIGPTLLEVSYTSMPYQHNLRPPQVTNPGVRLALNYSGEILTPNEEQDMADEQPQAEDSVEETEAAEAPSVEADIEALQAENEELRAQLEERDSENEQLSRRVTALEDMNTRQELAAYGITDDIERFIALKRMDAEMYEFAVRKAQVATVQEPIGKPGTESVDGQLSADSLIEMAANTGHTYGNGLSLWLAKNHPERMDEVLAVARD